jgi:hypothetical protein
VKSYEALKGKVFSRLKVLSVFRERIKNRTIIFLKCECKCGVNVTVRLNNVMSGCTRSCGCYLSEASSDRNKKHGMEGTRTYRIWSGIKTRCRNKNYHGYAQYGGRGINICDKWHDSFEEFYGDVGIIPDGMIIDRIDNNGDYEVGNFRLTTPQKNSQNMRTSKWWWINGIRHDSASVAGVYYNVNSSTIKNWCDGVIRSDKYYHLTQDVFLN